MKNVLLSLVLLCFVGLPLIAQTGGASRSGRQRQRPAIQNETQAPKKTA